MISHWPWKKTPPARICSFLLLLAGAGIPLGASAQDTGQPAGEDRVAAYNLVLGAQTIGGRYKFTEKTSLVEAAEQIQRMDSTIIKFSMSRRYAERNRYGLPKDERIRSLRDLAAEPSFKTVLDMPFAHYLIWAYAFAHEDAAWRDGFSAEERANEYDEVHALACHLLQTYRRSGKTFLLGHWEGDWHLRTSLQDDASPVEIRGMIEWLNTRQKAIDDANAKVNPQGVAVHHYTEANLVRLAMRGEPGLVNSVLPKSNVDYVSYSCYDTVNVRTEDIRKALHGALDYIESKLPAKPAITGKRVFVGEYGFPLDQAGTPQAQDRRSRELCQAALEWGCPYVLYWQLYCNEKRNGKHRGFWLIDDQNREQPFYKTLTAYNRSMKRRLEEFRERRGRLPTSAEFRKQAIETIGRVNR